MARDQLIERFIKDIHPETEFMMPMEPDQIETLAGAVDRCLDGGNFPRFEAPLNELRESLRRGEVLKGPVKFLVLGIMCLEACGVGVELTDHLYDTVEYLLEVVEK